MMCYMLFNFKLSVIVRIAGIFIIVTFGESFFYFLLPKDIFSEGKYLLQK